MTLLFVYHDIISLSIHCTYIFHEENNYKSLTAITPKDYRHTIYRYLRKLLLFLQTLRNYVEEGVVTIVSYDFEGGRINGHVAINRVHIYSHLSSY